MSDTIFALSTGALPAAIAIMRISGDGALGILSALTKGECAQAGSPPKPRPQPRHAYLQRIYHPHSEMLLDEAVVMYFPKGASVTGDDLVELHLHGSKAVVRAVEGAIEALSDTNGVQAANGIVRPAEPGEFTRRAYENGRMDLAEVEGLADLLSAENEMQRQSAMAQASGRFSAHIHGWRQRILDISAAIELLLDFSDEDDVEGEQAALARLHPVMNALHQEMAALLARPAAEKLHHGVKLVLAGPPNSGKSTLLNALVQREAAIVSDIAGTTRDIIEVPVSLGGMAFVFLDTAGLREAGEDRIEAIGMERTRRAMADADIILWLGEEGKAEAEFSGEILTRDNVQLWEVDSQIDRAGHAPKANPKIRISAKTGENLDDLVGMLCEAARDIAPRPDDYALNQRQSALLGECADALEQAGQESDLLLIGENMRLARLALDKLLGNSGTEDMLDSLFGRFCIGK